ncbi:MAG: HU family DNA-binding protein [Clostridia bacterium]|nr:HU family DNA-binding protein [Clostridia bacterium]
MNKVELIKAVALETGISRKDTEKVVLAMLDTIMDTVQNGEKVQLVGFGCFELRERVGRMGHNPQTQEQIEIAPSKAPAFRPGKVFKEKLN